MSGYQFFVFTIFTWETPHARISTGLGPASASNSILVNRNGLLSKASLTIFYDTKIQGLFEWILSVSLYPTFYSSRNVAKITPYYLTGDKEEKCRKLLFVSLNLSNRPVFKEEKSYIIKA